MPNLSTSNFAINNAGFTLLSAIMSSALIMLIFAIALHFLLLTVNTYNKIQLKFAMQQAGLIARQMLATDIYNSANISSWPANLKACGGLIPSSIHDLIIQKQIKPESDILILQDKAKHHTLVYYLRKSTLPARPQTYALYRDEIIHNAVAVAEAIDNFSVNITQLDNISKTSVNLNFVNNHKLEFTCNLPQ